MKEEHNTIIDVPIGRTIGQITKEVKLKSEYEGYTVNQELGNDGIYLTCTRGRTTQVIYVKRNSKNQ